MLTLAILIAFAWTDANGTPCWSDDLRRVPEVYRAEARQVEIGALQDYPRFTPVPQNAPQAEK